MVKFETQLVKDLDLTIIGVVGEVTFDKFNEFAGKFYEGRTTKHVIIDFTHGDLNMLSLDDIKNFITSRREDSEKRREGFP